MPRRRKPQIEAEWKAFPGNVLEYYIYFPGSKQDVVVWAKNMSHKEVKDLLFSLAKTPRSLVALDDKKENGWSFHVHRIPEEQSPFDMRYEVVGCGPDFKEVKVFFQRAETGIKALALAVALSRRAEPTPSLSEILEKINKEVVGG